MRKLNILKAVLDIFWFLSLIGAIGVLVFTPFLLFSSEIDIPVTIKGQEIVLNNTLSKVIVIINLIGGIIFLYSIYLLRKVVGLFQKREIFNEHVIQLFNLIGKLIIASSLISHVSLFVYKIIKRPHLKLTLDIGGYDSFLISISLGLLFMVVSVVFKIATTLKEENELTI